MAFTKRFRAKGQAAATLVVRTKAPLSTLREDRSASPPAAPLGFKPAPKGTDKTPPKSR